MASVPDKAESASFVEKYELWTPAQHSAAEQVEKQLGSRQIEVVRFSIPDQHGILRGKTLAVKDAVKALRTGVSITTTMFAKDTSHRTVFPVFSAGGGFGIPEMQGGADAVMVADPTTFRILPWAPYTGWLLCDAYFANGVPVPFATRQLLANVLDRLADSGFTFLAGLEAEFHIFRADSAVLETRHAGPSGEAPQVSLISRGYQYLTEQRYDRVDPILEIIRRDVAALDLPIRTIEVEFGPSQFEFTFAPTVGMSTADNMIIFRSAVKQICERHGLHATFMCRPLIPKVVSSGWHLHQCLCSIEDGRNAFVPTEENTDLSEVGRHYLAGLLVHARGATALSTPTINGYKRFASHSLAPDRAVWGRDNRGAMIRVLGGRNDLATRIENRVGEPAANPYLYLSSQILSGLDGMLRQLEPGPSADAPYEAVAHRLPSTLSEAVECLSNDAFLSDSLGSTFVHYYCKLKRAEIARFNAEVTDWEQREYFEIF